MIQTIISTYGSKLKFWLKDVFQSEHECRFRKRDVMNFKINPKCVKCGKPMEEA